MRPFSLFLALLASLAAGGCAGPPTDVVIVTLDTVRADRLGAYGGPSDLTPALDRLAAEGVVFEDATAPTPITLPSHCSLFTGRYPVTHGVRNNGAFVLRDAETTLAELLRGHGYATAAVVGSYPVQARYGLAQGFELYDDRIPAPDPVAKGAMPIFFGERDARTVTDRALTAWKAMEGSPRLLWAHYFDAHAPYAPPEPWATRLRGRPYDGEIAYLDAELGRLLDEVRRTSPRAVVVVVADHGEGLGEHGEATHGVFLYQSTLHVPFLLVAPGLTGGTRVEAPVSLVDVLPTVLGLLGRPVPEGLDGADLARLVRDGKAPSRPVHAESYLPRLQFRFHELAALRRGPLKYVSAPHPELYDLAQDPAETRDLHGGHPDEPALAAELAEIAQQSDPGVFEQAAGSVDPETHARLLSLGYAAAGAMGEAPAGGGRDPKEMTEYLARYDRAIGKIAAGSAVEGVDELRALVPLAPENYMAHFQIAAGLLSAGRPAEAEAELRHVVAAAPEFGNGWAMLAEVQGGQGKVDAAVASYRAAARAAPGLAAPLASMAAMLQEVGRFEEAGAAWREAVDLEPHDPSHARRLLALRTGRGERGRAVTELRVLSRKHTGSAPLLAVLASGLRQLGRGGEARQVLAEAMRLDPNHPESLVQLGELELAAGRHAEAEAAFTRAAERNPRLLEARFGRARALLASGQTLEADAAFAEVLQLAPSFSPAYTVRGLHLERAGQRERAVEAYRRALQIDRGDRAAWEGLRRLGAD